MDDDKFFEIVVPANQERERLDKFLTQRISSVSRARLQKGIAEGKVLVNGRPAKASHLIRPFEKIEVCIPKPKKVDISPENIPLNILYEDDHLIVLNKQAGMVVHPAFANYTGTLVNALLHHCGELSSVGGRQRPGIVHRLDKDTSGLLVVAKNDVAHQELSRQFREKSMEREYWTVAWWRFKKKKDKIETLIARSPKDRTRMSVQLVGKESITNYEVIEEFDFLSLVKLHLETGRTHQIRVHLSYIGHPVFADATYGGRNRQFGSLAARQREVAAELLQRMPRHALHAKVLGFKHPVKDRFMRFDSQLPEDMQQLLNRLRTE
ncbi:RluA family pseudouridine synthase [candidate division KSB1 bacterium]|nr:RluA family pseudouridine synthase [candidate division KSB1 bacterium]NIR68664.1 RluA family pseudouridine synthase [candidate division KSB1 bacterium]NIS27153.1 RluA family pseudouridine synthase [candidate division KSB1 bacterium]NIT74039.1 RluA family pseudouridine synthase [candidate division KSB1 bacterium]NIU27905.1 RluA family pseudouridine synthase [candidate division KSB1 bacterium]